ncbi:MAG: translocation/assembly module TamB domain-containing protein [Acidobacteria bacterium]|nr:translocation/assembly module TamB domain-containing protein [Acidobacteriota bacterium]MBI3662642.1 translocation/assembly module TamB domain-containing protein [Acidobacteriota bacterium]
MKLKWKRWLKILGAMAAALIVVAVILVQTGVVARWARKSVIARIEKMTGGRVELKEFRFSVVGLRAELDDFTLHGREPEGTPPFFHADKLVVDLRVVSFFRRKITLDEVRMEKPNVHVRIDKEGRSNAPAPKTERPAGQPWRERIFELTIRELRVDHGQLLINDVRVPLAAEGGEFNFALEFRAAEAGQESYEGTASWKKMKLAARRYLPFASDWRLKFTLGRESFEVNEFMWKLPHSELKAGARLASFAKPDWSFRYQGTLSLDDLRTILRKPNSPQGMVGFSGEGNTASGELSVKGSYAAREIDMPYEWFHTKGITSRGSYTVAKRRLEIPDFEARVLGGGVAGRVTMEFEGVKFRAESHAQGINLAGLLAAVNNRNFPVTPLHWNGSVAIDTVTTWDHDFKHFASRGVTQWNPPAELREGEIPVTARVDFDYSLDSKAAVLRQSEITTPTSRLELDGRLGAENSELAINLDVRDLLPWNDFINRLRGEDAEPRRIAGRATWKGRMTGDLPVAPTFVGHVRGVEAQYERLYWDEMEGDVTYSPEELRLERTQVRRGRSSVEMSLRLEFDDWSYLPESQWEMLVNVRRTPTDDLQALFGWAYGARALLSGEFRGRGTRSDPEFAGPFQLEQVEGWGFRADRARGHFALRKDEVRIARAEIQQGKGRMTGEFLYRMASAETPAEVEFDLDGSAITLEQIERIQTERFPLGGQLSFAVRGRGPVTAPTSEGTLRLENFKVGDEVMGSFVAQLRSDGRRAHAELKSTMAAGRLEGKLDLTLGGEYPLQGDLTVQDFDLDVFIKTALRLKKLTGHSDVDGRFRLSGLLARPETMAIEADISQLKFDYQYVKLENVGPLRLAYRGEEVRVEQAHIRGAETDLAIAGFVRFTGTRPVNLRLAGTVNLQLLGGFLPTLEARGAAGVNASIEGTLANPRITGGVHVENASANYGDFPAGLSKLRGDFVFDRSRLVFENVTAEAGGGKVVLGGTLTYGDGGAAVRYDLTMQATRVRVRYPEGMSWLAGGTMRLTGTTQAGVLSGRVLVERLLLAEGFDLASMIVASREGVRGPATTSPYVRNLQFDVEAASTPDARLEWSGARFESEANLRLRGTWEHPIFLGHIHLLSGEMSFRGNRYRLTRGDINFANPFRLDPALNVEATTTIRQYEITLNFTGPASRPVLGYRSDPPLPATDIIALLALGRTGEESELRSPRRVQSPEMGASTLLSEAISSQVAGRIEKLFGVSRFRVDPFLAGTGTDQNTSARVTIEQQVARDLTITYITNVTSTQQQVIQVEYNVNKNVSIVALRDQNGTFGLDVKFKKRFK